MKLSKYAQVVVSKVSNLKLISSAPLVTQATIESWLVTIDEINSLHWEDTSYQGRLLTEWKIFPAFSWMVAPSSVKVDASRQCQDMLVKDAPQTSKAKPLSVHLFNEVSSALASAFRKSELVSIDTLRNGAVLAGVYSRLIVEKAGATYVPINDTPVLPLPVRGAELIINNSYASESVDDVIEEFISRTLREAKSN
jgi:hypothetical protein